MKSLADLEDRDDLKIEPKELKRRMNEYLDNVTTEELIEDLRKVGIEVEEEIKNE